MSSCIPTKRRRLKAGFEGMTLVELVVVLTTMTMLLLATVGLVRVSLQAKMEGGAKVELHQEGLLALERITSAIKSCTILMAPNSHTPTRQLVAFSGTYNEDDDYYFDDPKFPRVDEDPSSDHTEDAFPGIWQWDDDGDGSIDEITGLPASQTPDDDDEDALANEDPLDGLDNDHDGNIDEDRPDDMNADGEPGFIGMDDDGDGSIDEGSRVDDDDEDGNRDDDVFDPTIFYWDPGSKTLRETWYDYVMWQWTTSVVCSLVTGFAATYHPPDSLRDPIVSVTLTMTGRDGETLILQEDAFPRNITQKTGKRVR